MELPNKPVRVFLNIHSEDTFGWLLSSCADEFLDDGYTIIADEVLDKKNQQLSASELLAKLENAIAKLKNIPIKNELHRNQINAQILKHKRSTEEIAPFSKNSSVSVHSIDTGLGEFKEVLTQFPELLEATLALRDKVIAETLEELRRKNPTKGIIVNIGWSTLE